MRLALRFLVVPVMIGAALVGVSQAGGGVARAANTEVMIKDNDGPTPNQGLDVRTGQWGFEPHVVAVTKGDQVTFNHPAGNFRNHNVISIARTGTSVEPVLESGTKFSSGLPMDTWIRPGNTWVLDTSTVDPGYYSYYCSLHPWMVGSITITP
jgi:plastocyanin